MLSLSWCKQDPDLLLSCGKDNRALCWNPQTSEIIGEVRDTICSRDMSNTLTAPVRRQLGIPSPVVSP